MSLHVRLGSGGVVSWKRSSRAAAESISTDSLGLVAFVRHLTNGRAALQAVFVGDVDTSLHQGTYDDMITVYH